MNQDPSEPNRPLTEISDEALRFVVRLHSGAATAADRKAFAAWRALSREHEAAAGEAEALWGEASNLHQDPETGIVRPGRRKRGPSPRAVIGNTLGLAAAGGGLWASGALRGWTSEYATGLGETRAIDLPDGSRVTLNARSAIDLSFTAEARRLHLVEGQAFFEVAPDPVRPFEVAVRHVRVRALGTAFDIDRNIADGGAAIAVTQHAVLVAADTAESVNLLEGQTLVVDRNGRLGAVEPSKASIVAAWRSGLYIAEDKPLADVIRALQAYHAGWIVIRGDDVAKLRVNAVLNLRTPDASLDALEGGLPISVRHLSSFLTVISG